MRIGPDGTTAGPGEDVVCAESHCASEGTVEVLVEPQLPGPLLAVVGDGPAARTLAELARTIGWRVTGEANEGADAVVVATMGTRDEERSPPRSRCRPTTSRSSRARAVAGVVLEHLREQGTSEEGAGRVRSPAGLDLGPCTQEEIAVAVLAELVAWRHAGAPAVEAPAEAVDPVCGMTVSVTESAVSAEVDGVTCTSAASTAVRDLRRGGALKIENSFEVDAPPEAAWALLMDVPRVIPCMPGATLAETVDDDHWKAKLAVKLGPISLNFDADVTRETADAQAHRAVLATDARESRGRGSAQATIESTLVAQNGGTRVDIVTDLMLTGPVAQYGRGMVQSVAGQLTSQFASCLQKQLAPAPAGGGEHRRRLPRRRRSPSPACGSDSARSSTSSAVRFEGGSRETNRGHGQRRAARGGGRAAPAARLLPA